MPDGTTADGPVSVRVEPFAEPAPTGIEAILTRVVVTNTSTKPVVISGEGEDLLYGFLVDAQGAVISAPPRDTHVAGSYPTLQPGESIDWPLDLWLERCGVERSQEIGAGTYAMHVWLTIRDADDPNYRRLLSVESLSVEIPG